MKLDPRKDIPRPVAQRIYEALFEVAPPLRHQSAYWFNPENVEDNEPPMLLVGLPVILDDRIPSGTFEIRCDGATLATGELGA